MEEVREAVHFAARINLCIRFPCSQKLLICFLFLSFFISCSMEPCGKELHLAYISYSIESCSMMLYSSSAYWHTKYGSDETNYDFRVWSFLIYFLHRIFLILGPFFGFNLRSVDTPQCVMVCILHVPDTDACIPHVRHVLHVSFIWIQIWVWKWVGDTLDLVWSYFFFFLGGIMQRLLACMLFLRCVKRHVTSLLSLYYYKIWYDVFYAFWSYLYFF